MLLKLISAIVYCGGPSSWSQNSQMLEQGLDITAPFWGPQPSTCGPWHLLPVVRILGSVHSVHSWTSKLSRFHTSAISETAQRCQEKTCCQPLSQRSHHFLFAPSCPRYRTASQDGMVSTLDPPWAWGVARRARWQHRWLWTRPSRQPLVACAFSCSGVSEAIDGRRTKRDFLSSWTLLIDDYWCSLQFLQLLSHLWLLCQVATFLPRAFITGKYDVGGLCNGNLASLAILADSQPSLSHRAFVRNWLMLFWYRSSISGLLYRCITGVQSDHIWSVQRVLFKMVFDFGCYIFSMHVMLGHASRCL